MNKRSGTSKEAADKLVRGIKRKTRKHYSAEEKIRIVLAGLVQHYFYHCVGITLICFAFLRFFQPNIENIIKLCFQYC